MAYIDAHKDRVVEGHRLGVEPIVDALRSAGVPIALSTYYAAKDRDPSASAPRDAELVPRIRKVHTDNVGVYGARGIVRGQAGEGPSHHPQCCRCPGHRRGSPTAAP